MREFLVAVAAERERQRELGYDSAHDVKHTNMEWVRQIERHMQKLQTAIRTMDHMGEQTPLFRQQVIDQFKHRRVQVAALLLAWVETETGIEALAALLEQSGLMEDAGGEESANT